jgi:tripartite-type tricarboxylate transporter receptor subunit TctC
MPVAAIVRRRRARVPTVINALASALRAFPAKLRHAHGRALLVALGVATSAVAFAQPSWPERPVQLIVPFPAGGAVDIIARPFADIMAEHLHQPFVVVPRDGASGTIGAGVVAAAKPDGYTLAFTPNGPITIQPHVISSLAYKFDSLAPLCQVFAVQYVLAVRPDSPYRSLGEFIAAAKSKPGKVSYGFGGIATSPHLAISQLAIASDAEMLGVPFRGDPPVILALKGGEIDAAMLNIAGAKAQGFRILATFAPERQSEIPDVPTVRELGYPVVSSAFGGLLAPKGLPADIATKIEGACEKTVADERYRRAVRDASQQPVYRSGADFAKVLRDDYAIKGDVVKRAGIKGP